MLLIALLLTGYTLFIVLGSAFDLDSNQKSEGAMQMLMLEEMPITPRRLQLFRLEPLAARGDGVAYCETAGCGGYRSAGVAGWRGMYWIE